MLEMRGISKKFAAVVALREASLSVKAGEIMALLGANGSGKSTLMKVLSGLVNPDKGTVIYQGKELHIHSAANSKALNIAAAYQDLSLVPAMNVIDNIVMGIEPKNALGIINKKAARNFALSWMEKFKIECNAETLTQSLPPSTQSMIEIAKAVASNPRLLILDEATASLHSDEVTILFDILEELKNSGVAIIMVTHRMNEIYRVCDRCTILRGGETVASGQVKDMDLNTVVYHMTGKKPDVAGVTPGARPPHKADEEALLEVKGLSLPGKLKGIHFHAYAGEIVGIGGLDGQGQQEFLRAILGDVKYESGDIILKGKKVKFHQPADAVKRNMGFISGDRNKESVFPIRTVSENLYAGAVTHGTAFAFLPPQKVDGFSREAVKKYRIVTGGLNNPASSLSGGNQQKLVVGRWMAVAPDLLLLDDPTKGVDISTRQEIHRILKERASGGGLCALYSSSDNEELLEISDRIYVFYEGRLSAELRGEDRTEEKLVAAMFGLAGGNEGG
ncbi:MAG: sugar ABC transporter ATP-binding protein [Treponema sp.]|jgi:ABC-type sugar transport system ATPase subunit|nr:sugar ABC transporter ATP-binding protein [Treponema sp.]